MHRSMDDLDSIRPPPRVLRSKSNRMSASARNSEIYFPEVETKIRGSRESPAVNYKWVHFVEDSVTYGEAFYFQIVIFWNFSAIAISNKIFKLNFSYVRSTDDISSSTTISSGYSSAEPGLSRTSSLSNSSKRVRSKTRDDKMASSYSTLPRTKKPEKTLKTRTMK